MKRFFMTLAYNGKNYSGWQIQPNAPTVQQTLQEAMSTILRQKIEIVGAGRTDSGVHARKMIAHFDWRSEPLSTEALITKLNGFLPKDISVYSIREVKGDAHARFSALERAYSYQVTSTKDPFLNEYKHRVFFKPNIEMMNQLCSILLQTKDFTSFSKLHTDVKTNICDVSYAKWERVSDNDYLFTIKADRFLRNMVRSIVGTLLQAGRGKITETDFKQIIAAKDRQAAGESAPAKGLFLENVVYPDDIWL